MRLLIATTIDEHYRLNHVMTKLKKSGIKYICLRRGNHSTVLDILSPADLAAAKQILAETK